MLTQALAVRLDALTGPDRALVRAALARLADTASAPVQQHSRRMIGLAADLAAVEGRTVDLAPLACACAFHDLGLELRAGGATRAGSFPYRSAEALAILFADHAVPSERGQPWLAAARGHLSPVARRRETPEDALLRRAAWLEALAWGDASARRVRRARGLRGIDRRLLAQLSVGYLRDAGRAGLLRRPRPRGSTSWPGPG